MTFDKGEKNKRGLSPQSNPSVSTKKRATDRKENQAWEQKRQEEKIPREGADARSSNLTMPSLSGPLKKEETEAQDEHGRHFPYNAPSPTTEAEFGKQDQSMLDAKQQIEAMVFAMQALANNNAKAKRLVDPWVGKFQQVPEVLNQAKNGHEIQKLLKEKNLSSWLLQQRNRHEKGGPLDPDKESPLITKDIADLQRKLLKAIGFRAQKGTAYFP
ncbi:hypothetical protein SEMRO_30_G019940.1 [Seminavis robusta]|uniref:Uncharacterized protein n=1 Tax=Seminavis robusta TaxID=568900 RepID=A0A9N8D813_9STRA|nr:hypothetical protein SEMRO_30_G019940.1 [Seminavis robusta]|eukprot:Sro30_g019940.1 n/a (215) ;mRNA; f:160954-161598